MSLVIGLAGDSGAGKTSLLKFFENLWGNKLLVIEGDCYHKWERKSENWENFTPLNPNANTLEKAETDIESLKNGKEASISEYDHSTGKFKPPEIVNSKPYIIYAGLHSLYTEKLRKLEDIKIFLNTDEDLRLFWKLKRDVNERGYTKEKVQESIKKRIADSKKYIKPQILYADVIINIFDNNLNFEDLNYVPQVSMEIMINKELIYTSDILHILKNINFKITEDEKFIKATYEEKFELFQSIHI